MENVKFIELTDSQYKDLRDFDYDEKIEQKKDDKDDK